MLFVFPVEVAPLAPLCTAPHLQPRIVSLPSWAIPSSLTFPVFQSHAPFCGRPFPKARPGKPCSKSFHPILSPPGILEQSPSFHLIPLITPTARPTPLKRHPTNLSLFPPSETSIYTVCWTIFIGRQEELFFAPAAFKKFPPNRVFLFPIGTLPG